jgi:hypothetical protein
MEEEMKLPTDALDIAISWLRANEGDNGEADACNAVADWLEQEEQSKLLRKAAREAGVPVAKLRKLAACSATCR